MSELPENDSAVHSEEQHPNVLPDELPPVEPPSAGFIVQLFVIPAIIVAGLIGAWVLLNRMVTSQQNVSHVMNDLASTNEHRRWRAAFNLAQLLEADAQLGAEGQQLARNPEVARALADLLQEQLQTVSKDEKQLKHQAFLARTLGWFETPKVVIPVLREAMNISPEPDETGESQASLESATYQSDAAASIRGLQQEVRRSAISSVARIAGRILERGQPFDHSELVGDLINLCSDEASTVRQLAVFSLGLFPTEKARQQLKSSLLDADLNTRTNAAVALARQDCSDGYPVFVEVLQEAEQPIDSEITAEMNVEQRRRYTTAVKFRRLVALKNTLKAINQIAGQFDHDQREKLTGLIRPHAEESEIPEIQTTAEDALEAFDHAT